MQKNKKIDRNQLFSLYDVQRRFVDLTVVECGHEQCAPIKRVDGVAKKVYTLHIVESGKGVIEFDGVTKELRANDIFVIYPGQETSYFPDENSPWSYLWIVFEGIQADELVSATGFCRSVPYMHIARDSGVLAALANAVNAYESKGKIVTECVGYLYVLLGLLEGMAGSAQELSAKQRYIKEALMFIHFNWHFNITIGDIAHNLRVSLNYLSAIFREVVGVSPKQYLFRYRMERAHKMLQQPDVKVKDVAKNVGYKDQLHFGREFKRHWGYPPSALLIALK